MKRLIVILIIALILVGAALGAAYFFVPELLGIKEEGSEVAVKEPEVKIEKQVSDSLNFPINNINIPLVYNDSIDRRIIFDVMLSVDPAKHDYVQSKLPYLRDAYIQYCYSVFPQQYKKFGRMNLPRLKVSLIKVTKKIIGEDDVRDVFIQSYVER